ncbi:MAG: glycosyltransferase [bacterium]
MRIGLLTNSFPPNKDGVSVAVDSLMRNLQKLGHEVFVATPDIPANKYPKNVLALPSYSLDQKISTDRRLANLYSGKIVDFFKENKIQIIHSHDTISGGAEAVLIALQLDIPCIHTFHTLVEEYNYYNFPGYKPLVRKYLRAVCNSYDNVIAPSEKIYKHLLKMAVKIPLSLVPNVPNLDHLKAKVNPILLKQIKSKINYTVGDQICLTFCRIAKEKGLYEGINSMKKVFATNPKAKYIIAGGGPEEKKLKQYIDNNKLENKVFLIGEYSRRDLSTITSIAKLFLYTSTTDNLPTNIFEAMYFGLPVVSINDTSVDYLLKDSINGFKSTLNKIPVNIIKILKSHKLHKTLSQNAEQEAKKIKPKIITEQHLKLYSQIIRNFENNKLQENTFTDQLEKFEKVVNKGLNPIGKLYQKIFLQSPKPRNLRIKNPD